MRKWAVTDFFLICTWVVTDIFFVAHGSYIWGVNGSFLVTQGLQLVFFKLLTCITDFF
jgi:hypothetical protein